MYLIDEHNSFGELMDDLRARFLRVAKVVDVGEWHSQPVDNPLLVSRELQDTIIVFQIPNLPSELEAVVKPNLPWAEDHFQERVSGRPLNPPPSNEYWPYAQAGNASHKSQGDGFSHTYPERFWPKHAGEGMRFLAGDPDWYEMVTMREDLYGPNRGIRFALGDLQDVVTQLFDNNETRQAYLPVWFPEDTGAVHGERVPCSLGYHFMIRNGKLSCNYYIRSCDFVRHFRDDFYMAARLMQWVVDHIPEVRVGELKMYISSFHIFEGDLGKLKTS